MNERRYTAEDMQAQGKIAMEMGLLIGALLGAGATVLALVFGIAIAVSWH